jgi:ABC-type antimicrobial peptide transport system permease subunit
LLAAAAIGRIIADQLYGVTPSDPLTFTAAAALVIAAIVAACWGPARRASRVDPLVALRQD